MGEKALICGGRTFDRWSELQRVLADRHAERPFSLIISGGAPGADRMAEKWANIHHIPLCVFPPNWTHLGKRAGPIRNGWMLEFGRPDVVIAFPGGHGTLDMMSQARAAGCPVIAIGGWSDPSKEPAG